MSAASFGFGTVSICAYQRSMVSTKPSMSLSRLAATGCSFGSRSASATQALSASTAGSISRSLRTAGDAHGDFPEVGLGLEVVAPVALDRHAPDQVPGHQLADRVRDVGAREPERGGDLLGGERPLGEIEQRMDLADRAVDAPLRAHVAPMQDEALDRAREQFAVFSVISVMTEISERRKALSRGGGGVKKDKLQTSGRLAPSSSAQPPWHGSGWQFRGYDK